MQITSPKTVTENEILEALRHLCQKGTVRLTIGACGKRMRLECRVPSKDGDPVDPSQFPAFPPDRGTEKLAKLLEIATSSKKHDFRTDSFEELWKEVVRVSKMT